MARTIHKIHSLETLQPLVDRWRFAGDCVVFTNGCFDLLHAGHTSYLEESAGHGDRLVVGLNSDQSVQRLKGKSRPIVGQAERAQMLAALECVDAVILFEEDTPLNTMLALKPDVITKGADYDIKDVVGAQEVAAWGGRAELIPLVEGLSTSQIIEKLKK